MFGRKKKLQREEEERARRNRVQELNRAAGVDADTPFITTSPPTSITTSQSDWAPDSLRHGADGAPASRSEFNTHQHSHSPSHHDYSTPSHSSSHTSDSHNYSGSSDSGSSSSSDGGSSGGGGGGE